MTKRMGRNPTCRVATSIAALSIGMMAACAADAQTAVRAGVSAQSGATYVIPAQPLSTALARWSAISGIRVQSIPQGAQALTSSPLDGSMTAVAALDTLLQGTGYSFRYTRVDVVVIEAVATGGGLTDTIGVVRVQGTTDIATQGVNGSTDPTATEGSDSYAADQTTVATKVPLPLKDTPQSVSVITTQQLADRNITNLQQALVEAPGISVVYGDTGGSNNGRSNLQPSFFSRGFQVQRLQVDGGAPLNIGTQAGGGALVPQLNMAAYDHIEILRGADGLFNGSGEPGGVINLTRKRPVDHQQLLVSQLVESWNGFNTTVDGSSPIAFDGKLRARVVLTRQSNEYFYDTAKSRQFMIFGTLEAQLTPTTLVAGGINYQTQDSLPFFNGLIGGIRDGKAIDLKLPRSTCFCFDFNRQSFDTRELFGRVEQSIGGDWKVKLNGSTTRQVTDYSYAGVTGTLGSADPRAQPQLADSYGHAVSTQYQVDGNLAGSLSLLGHKQWLVIGGNYASSDGGGEVLYSSIYRFGGPAVDPLAFNQADYGEPDHSGPPDGYRPVNRSANLGAYATLRLTPIKPLHLTVGMRYNRFSGRSVSYNVCRSDFGCMDFATNNIVGNGVDYGFSDVSSSTAKFFPAGYMAAALDILPTLSLYASKTSIYIDNSLFATVDEQTPPPITGNNFEGGLKYASADHRLTASATGFYLLQKGILIRDESVQNPNADPLTGELPDGRACCYIDGGTRNRSWGVDLEVAGEIFAGMQVSASYVYNNTRQTTKGADVAALQSQSPKHLYKLWVKYSVQPGSRLKGGYIGGGLQGQSAGSATQPVCTIYGEFGCEQLTNFTARLAPRAILSLLAGWEFNRKLSVAITVNNLLDKTYYNSVGLVDGGNWYGAPRSFSVSLRGAF